MSMGGGNEQGFAQFLSRMGMGGTGDTPVGGGQLPWGPKPAAPADGEAAAAGPDKAGLYELIQRNNASLSDEAPPPSSGPYQNVGGRRPSTAKPVAKASSGLAERLAAAKAKREEKQAALRSDRGSRRGTWGNPFNDPRMTGRDRNGNTVSGYAGIEDARKGWSPFGAGK